jgi:hypothetical protein
MSKKIDFEFTYYETHPTWNPWAVGSYESPGVRTSSGSAAGSDDDITCAGCAFAVDQYALNGVD